VISRPNIFGFKRANFPRICCQIAVKTKTLPKTKSLKQLVALLEA
jgi:hypothetical protein